MATSKSDEHVKMVNLLLKHYGKTYSEQAGIKLKDTPAPLFQMLILSLMLSARIAADKAVSATRSLFDSGFTTAAKMVDATWQQRVDAITWSGYKRYDERTATMLGETAQHVNEHYDGDLRKLRKTAQDEGVAVSKLLTQFKGIGAVGADIFLREVQSVWSDIYPFADERILKIATDLGLPQSVDKLSELCSQQDFPRLTAALMQVKLKREQHALLKMVDSSEK